MKKESNISSKNKKKKKNQTCRSGGEGNQSTLPLQWHA